MYFIIGQVDKTKEGAPRVTITGNNQAAIHLWCGTDSNKGTGTDTNVSITAWTYATESIKNLKGGERLLIIGNPVPRKESNGNSALSVSAEEIHFLSETNHASLGITSGRDCGFINAVFQSQNGGYRISFSTNYYKPMYKQDQGSGLYTKSTGHEQRSYQLNVPKSFHAFKQIAKMIEKLTGVDIGEAQATPEQLECLKGCFITIDDSFHSFSSSAGNDNRDNLYMNIFVKAISFIRVKAGKGNQQAAPTSSGQQHYQQPDNDYPDYGAGDDIPFPAAAPEQNSANNGAPGYDGGLGNGYNADDNATI